MSNTKQFAVGDRVSWKSQAGGHWKTKTGTVVEVVPAFKIPRDKRFGSNRKHVSYIVEVTFAPKRSRGAIKSVRVKKPERYWPVVGNLRLVARGSTSTTEAAAGGHGIKDMGFDGDVPDYTLRRGTPVKVDRESFTDVKIVERGPNTEQLEKDLAMEDLRTDHLPVQVLDGDKDMLWKDVQDAERAIADANSESTN